MVLGELLKELSEKDIRIIVREGQLLISDKKNQVTDKIRQSLKENKEEILKQFGQRQPPLENKGIPLADRSRDLCLSCVQQRIWFVDKVGSGNPQFNLPQVLSVTGRFHIPSFTQAVNAVVERHEMLRTSFIEKPDGEVFQKVHGSIEAPVETIDLQHLDSSEQKVEIKRLAELDAATAFDLTTAPLLRVTVLLLSEFESILLINTHHIASDGISLNILLRDITQFYLAFKEGKKAGLKPLAVQYVDYANWQRSWLESVSFEKDIDYWLEKLKDLPEKHSIPLDRTRPVEQNIVGRFHSCQIDGVLTGKIRALCKQQDATLFMFLQTAFAVLIGRYSNCRDVVIGTPVSGRFQRELENVIGCFLNMLVLRTECEFEAGFTQMLAHNKQQILDAFSHQLVPYEILVEKLNPRRSLSYNPLFQILLVLEPANSGNDDGTILDIQRVEQDTYNIKNDIELYISESENALNFSWAYNVDLFDLETVEQLSDSFIQLLQSIVDNPVLPVCRYDLLSDSKKKQVLLDWNANHSEFERELPVHRLFERQAECTPDRIALIYEEERLTYRELNERANQLARYLVSIGVETENLVGLCIERSSEMLIAALAILKAGAAYLPLDPSYPAERLAYMLADSEAKWVVSKGEIAFDNKAGKADLVDLDDSLLQAELQLLPPSDLTESESRITSGNLAYVIYTSGSTGKPKGVCIEHRALHNLLHSMRDKPGIRLEHRLLAVTSIGFDIAGLELYLPLISGAELHIASSKICRDGMLLSKYLNKNRIDFLQATPSTWQVLVHSEIWKPESGFVMLCGGEAMSPALAKNLLSLCDSCGGTLWNMYGPTETTIWSSVTRVTTPSIKLDRGIANTQFYVLDSHNNLAGIGIPGELCIGGKGLARGYWQRPDLTSERFIEAPFSEVPGKRIYRTGDLVRWDKDGRLDFLGRIDHQVKIRGYRVELGEIEASLSQVEGVQSCAVLAATMPDGEKQLVAYIVDNDSCADLGGHVARTRYYKEKLREFLPDFMTPGIFQFLPEMPLTPNGKIDRSALPLPGSLQWESNEYAESHRRSADAAAPYGKDRRQSMAWKTEDSLIESYIGARKDFLNENDLEKLAYWRKQLAGLPRVHSLPLKSGRPVERNRRSLNYSSGLDTQSGRELKELSQRLGGDLFTVLQSAFSLLLHIYSRETDIVMGTSVADQGDRQLVILRSDLSGNPAFSQLMEANRAMALAALEHYSAAFGSLVREISAEHSSGYNPLFQILFVLQSNASGQVTLSTPAVEAPSEDYSGIAQDLELIATEHDNGISLDWRYNPDLFDNKAIENFNETFSVLLNSVLENPESPIQHLTMVSDEQHRQLTQEWSHTSSARITDCCIHHAFAERAEQIPHETALKHNERTITFSELNSEANRLAHLLIDRGLESGATVGLSIERSIPMVVAMLSIVKAGAAYLPFDPDYPQQRIQQILEDSEVDTVISQTATIAKFSFAGLNAICLDDPAILRALTESSSSDPIVSPSPENAACVIYTSGTTGRPKGVKLSHRNIVNRIDWMQNTHPFNTNAEGDREVSSQKTSLNFVDHIAEIFHPLSAGVCNVIIDTEKLLDSSAFIRSMIEERVTRVTLVPSLLKEMVNEPGFSNLTSLKLLVCSGEALGGPLARAAQRLLPEVKILNLYGASEVGADATWYQVDPIADNRCDVIPIGKPITNIQAYILNDVLQLLPAGAIGELFIGGEGVALGYTRKSLEENRFLRNPFSQSDHSRLFRTGDLVCWLPDGNLRFVGRVDHQVKIRGMRIELAEVEAALLALEQVRDALVMSYDGAEQGQRLVAFVVPKNNIAPKANGDLAKLCRNALSSRLPDYMIPQAYISLQQLPLTPNGKVDRISLTKLIRPDMFRRNYIVPVSNTEIQLCRIWEGILNSDAVGTEDNFFEIGGHSLLAGRVIGAVRERLNVELSFRELFSAPTVKQMAKLIDAKEQNTVLPPILPVGQGITRLPLSFGQQRLWFMHQFDGSSSQYNISTSFALKGDLNLTGFRNALRTIIQRHSVLRSRFHSEEGVPYQQIEEIFELPLFEYDWTGIDVAKQSIQVKDLIRKEAAHNFDLENDILVRIHLIKLSAEETVVVFNIHHIVSDGWSLGILVKEFGALYSAYIEGKAEVLPPLDIQYADFACWQRNWLRGEVLEKQLGYWKRQLSGIPQAHSLRLDKPRPLKQTFDNGSSFQQRIDKLLVYQLKALGQKSNATLFMVLQTAFSVLIGRYSNEDDIVIGSPVAGRSHREVENLIGFFVNTLVLRTDLSENPAFSALLDVNRNMILDAYTHQSVPFETVVDTLNPVRSRSHSPLFQILFVLQNNEQNRMNLPRLRLEPVRHSAGTVQFDLELYIGEFDSGMVLDWHFNGDIFTAETIQRLAESFTVLLQGIAAQPDAPIQMLPIVTAGDKALLLNDWNNTRTAYADGHCLHHGFERLADLAPDRDALKYKGQCYSYREVNQRANQLAHYLIGRGVEPGDLVGLGMERSAETIIAILAIMKAGATYVPLDPHYPQQRLRYMLADSRVQTIISIQTVKGCIPLAGQTLICIDESSIADSIALCSMTTPPVACQPESVACVIYTSGTTGQPKGVMLPHSSMVNRVCWMQEHYPLKSEGNKADICCQKTSLNFVDHIAEVFHPLSQGVVNVIIDDSSVVDVPALIDMIGREHISRITLVPSLLKALLAQKVSEPLNALKLVVSSGEALPLKLANEFNLAFPNTRLLNLYGSTEVGADVTAYELNYTNQRSVLKYFSQLQKLDFTHQTEGGSPLVLPMNLSSSITSANVGLEQLMPHFSSYTVPSAPCELEDYIAEVNQKILPYLVNVSSEKFIGHMTSALPDFMPEFARLVAMLNQNMVKVETSKSLSLLERQVLAMTHHRFFGCSDHFYRENIQNPLKVFGIITSGGSLANITSLQCARNKALMNLGYAAQEIAGQGAYALINRSGYKRMVILCSPLAHYSVRKAANLLGIGEENIRLLEQDSNQQVVPALLERKIEACRANDELIIAIVGIAGATETGTIDPLADMHAIAQKFGIHFHVDAAWGGAFQFSDRHRHLIKGIELADSITLCAHKQLYLPQGISMCLFKDVSYTGIVSVHANYQAQRGSYDLGQYSLEGSRPALSLLLHAAYHLISARGYASLIDRSMERTAYFSGLINSHEAFELVGKPETNIINYRYIPRALRNGEAKVYTRIQNEEINWATERIQIEQFLRGETFVSRTKVLNKNISDDLITVFRVVISNPVLTNEVLYEVLRDQLSVAVEVVEGDERLDEMQERFSVSIEQFDRKPSETWTVPIGKPIANNKVYVLNSSMQLAPIGAKGDLYVSGVGLAKGYLHLDELTEKCFVDNPFSDGSSSRLYKTGDTACWLPDGNLEYLGRSDNQVKLRGLRIEVEEIEYHLQKNSNVQDVVVDIRNISGGPDEDNYHLVAYVVPKQGDTERSDDAGDKNEFVTGLKQFLRDAVPDFMIPQFYVLLDALPSTPSGKIDRKRLPDAGHRNRPEETFIEPRNNLERTLCTIWMDVLKRDRISVNDNYFALGGHSLLATVTVNRINEELGVSVPVTLLFEYPTVAGLVFAMQALSLTKTAPEKKVEVTDDDVELII